MSPERFVKGESERTLYLHALVSIEWHSHPKSANAAASKDDRKALTLLSDQSHAVLTRTSAPLR